MEPPEPPRPRRRRKAEAGAGGARPSTGLERLGIRAGQRLRFRRQAGERWTEGVAIGVEKDGSIGVRDADGRFRAIEVPRIEARVRGARRGERWEPLADIAARVEQLGLF